MAPRLQGRIAVITGSSSGIGRATAFAMAAEGAKIVCADLQEGSWRSKSEIASVQAQDGQVDDALKTADDVTEDELKGPTHERVKAIGGEAIFVKVDVTDPVSVEGLVAAAVRQWGRLDIMVFPQMCGEERINVVQVNNAGFALETRAPAPIWETPLDLFQKTMDANVNGVFYGTKYAAAQMIKQDPLPSGDRGWILNACSVYGLVGTPHAPAYCTSKGAVANLTRAAALDCAPYRIHVNAVNPGYVATHMTDSIFSNPEMKGQVESLHPFRGVGRPEDIAKAYVFLASDDAQWMSGVNMPVDGGYTAR